jgi:hypothetical protein
MDTGLDREALIEALRRLPLKESSDVAWARPPAVRVIDCVLSLNRNYNRVVVPRLDRFEQRRPEIRSVRQLQELIKTYPSPHAFVKEELNYDHEERANTLTEVVEWLNREMTGASEDEFLRHWAAEALPSGHLDVAIHGFGLAAFQYLRMLFGANTTKPDRHICNWVSGIIGRPVAPIEALRLLEKAALAAGVNLRNADTTIWEQSAR